ncbi:hypothetical protein BH24ACT3_BH24ACT3_19060 [soil metagenome]
MDFGQLAWAVAVTSFLCVPLAVSLWAFLDVARRPAWAWALAGRSQVAWLAVVMFGILSVIGGLAIYEWYLVKVRPQIAAVEAGDVGTARRAGRDR